MEPFPIEKQSPALDKILHSLEIVVGPIFGLLEFVDITVYSIFYDMIFSLLTTHILLKHHHISTLDSPLLGSWQVVKESLIVFNSCMDIILNYISPHSCPILFQHLIKTSYLKSFRHTNAYLKYVIQGVVYYDDIPEELA